MPSASAKPTVTLAQRLRRSEQVMFQDIGGEAVLLDLDSEQYFSLNEVGVRIWELLPERENLAAVHKALCEEFDALPALIEHDLLALASQLAQAGLVTVEG